MTNKNNKFRASSISIVVPVMNEENNLRELSEKLTEVLVERHDRYEIIFIDDGSTDSSFEILQEIQNHNKNVKVIRFRRNFGKAAAYSAGFRHASGDVVVTMDADLQDDPEEIGLFVEKIEQGFDMVVGWRFNRQDTFGKRLSSRFFNIVVAFFSGLRLRDFHFKKNFKRSISINEDQSLLQARISYNFCLPVLAYSLDQAISVFC